MVAAYDKRGAARIVIVGDHANLVELLVGELRDRHYDAVGFTSAAEGLQMIAAEDVDLMIGDIELPEFRGTELLQAALDRRPGLLVVLTTAFDDVDLAVQALHAGAADFVVKPFKLDALLFTIERTLRGRTRRRDLARLRDGLVQTSDHELIARSEAMQRTTDLARKASRSLAPVLITGERGTGKSVVARWIHQHAKRHGGPFVHVACEVLHGSIAESKLFGDRDGEGLIAGATDGTILFDEIFELPVQVQARVLRFIETSIRTTTRAARVILSTNRLSDEPWRERDPLCANLAAALEAQGALHIHMPPLRERMDDIPDLVRRFLARAVRASHPPTAISDAALRWLMRSEWPGNVSELAEVVERALARADHDTLVIDDVVAERTRRPESVASLMSVAAERKLSLAEVEISYIKRMLLQTGNNVSRTAQILGIDRRTLYRKLSESD